MTNNKSKSPWIGALWLCAGLSVSLSAWAGPGAHGPNGEHLDAPATGGASPSGLMRLPDGSVQVPKAAQRRMGIRTVLAPEGSHPATVTLNARVVMDPRSAGQVQATVGGRIEPPPQGLPVAGQAVRQGQVLAWLRPTLGAGERADQRAGLAELRSGRQLAEQRVARLNQLEGSVPAKDIEAARSELRSLREREAILGQSLDGVQTLVAPVGGVLASARVLAGQVVASEELLFEVVDPQRVLIEAQVSDPALAAQVQSAVVQGLPQVTLTYQGAARVMREGAVPLTFAARLQNTVLAIGQPLTLVATLSRQQPGVAVPAEAVVRNPSNETVVWIKLSAERFLSQPVQTQPLDASTVLVTRGLSPDNRVVVQGASLINQIR